MYLNKYDIIKKLGKGSYGTVYLVQNQHHEQFAMKLISLEQNSDPYLRAFF
jgi:serine/threonine protein kinase